MSDLYHANLQNDEVSEGGINPYFKDRCASCKYCKNRKGRISKTVCFCELKGKFVPPDSVKECFESK